MRNIKTNPKLCQDDAAAGRAHAYRVALPALAEVKHLPLTLTLTLTLTPIPTLTLALALALVLTLALALTR